MISRQAWSDANFYRPHIGIRFIRQLWRRRCGCRCGWVRDILIENLRVHPSLAQRVISGTIECLLDSIIQVNGGIVLRWLLLHLYQCDGGCTADLSDFHSVTADISELLFCTCWVGRSTSAIPDSWTIGLLLYNVSALTVLDWLPTWVIINYYFPWLVTCDYCCLTCLLW